MLPIKIKKSTLLNITQKIKMASKKEKFKNCTRKKSQFQDKKEANKAIIIFSVSLLKIQKIEVSKIFLLSNELNTRVLLQDYNISKYL